MSPHLSQLNVMMAHRNYFRRNNLWILKLATYTTNWITILGANWQHFRLERIAKCSYYILSTQNIKVLLICNENKEFLLPIWWYNRGLFALGNKYFGVFILNGLNNATCCSWYFTLHGNVNHNRSDIITWEPEVNVLEQRLQLHPSGSHPTICSKSNMILETAWKIIILRACELLIWNASIHRFELCRFGIQTLINL